MFVWDLGGAEDNESEWKDKSGSHAPPYDLGGDSSENV